MPPLERRTAAVVVTYRPQADPTELIERLLGTVALTIVADNTVDGHPALVALTERAGLRRLHTGNRGGLAGAYNRALEAIRESHPELTHIVFLDEDSDAGGLGSLLRDPEVVALLDQPGTAAVAPAYVERATGMRGKYIDLARWRLRYLPRKFAGLRQVAFAINSMSVWRLDVLRQIGPYNEALAVDHVDTEICLRARRLGYTIHVSGNHEFLHSIGERRRFRFLGRDMQAGGHGPGRRYLIGRNTAWLCRRYLWREPAFSFLCVTRLGYEVVGICIAENQRWAKLSALLRGSFVGLLGPSLSR